jgi:hypothetical protein
MSRPQKIIPPVKGSFQNILSSVAMGSGAGKQAAIRLSSQAPATNLAQPKPAAPQPRKP